jgi:hypothetical protein
MNGVSFAYVPSSKEEPESHRMMRKKHLQDASVFDDNFYLTQIFNYLSETYNNFTSACRNDLKQQNEETITDYVRRKLQNNKDFCLDGFIVNTEARNQDKVIGYYDLKFEHSDWLNQYFVLECKPVNATKSKIDAYIHKTSRNQDDDGGLYRFLINKYATDKLFGGILGYIVSSTPEEVINRLKKKIQSLQITTNGLCFGNIQNAQLLAMPVNGFPYSFQSDHVRIRDNQLIEPVHIFHLFFDLTQSRRSCRFLAE